MRHDNNQLPNIGESCTAHSECQTTMGFLVQSNCPFSAACIGSHCKVVCPLTFCTPNPEAWNSHPYVCREDSDCDCTERGERTFGCLCVDSACVSIEAE